MKRFGRRKPVAGSSRVVVRRSFQPAARAAYVDVPVGACGRGRECAAVLKHVQAQQLRLRM